MASFGFLLLSFLAFCSGASHFAFASNATLPKEEVDVLRVIAKTLGKYDWNFSVDPCNTQRVGNWSTRDSGEYKNNLTCDCSYASNTVCHVTRIILKGQNLGGTLPPELVNLPYLKEIDLTRNYLSGTIPLEWGSAKHWNLSKIAVLGNRLTGQVPVELTNIATLEELVLVSNQFYGDLSQGLGNFAQLRKLHLSSNNFTGELPETLAKLTTLTDFRISDNQFSGQIPSFIKSWTNLTRLEIQGSGLSGPIPLEISLLTKLEDLRISDLNGSNSTFPQLNNTKSLKTLILRSCNINGKLPPYLREITTLRTLDLSFNKLTGDIPQTFSDLNATFIFLTGNLLNGTVPKWTYKDSKVDLSYNNFSTGNTCQEGNVNLFASSSMGNGSGLVSCLKSNDCKQKSHYSFHINCGGNQVTDHENTTYDRDFDTAGVANFIGSGANWVVSSTGYFLDNEDRVTFIESKESDPSMPNVDELYMSARLSPISLTYYGFCLVNGSYTVKLHFAEIMFDDEDDKTYSSLGRRIFDVYIQGKQVLKDFNIAKEAGGVGKPIIMNFTALVSDNTLEIRLQWAGKGTTVIPVRSVYGPLISAISVESDDKPPPPENGSGISAGALVGIVAAGVIIFVLIFALLYHLKQKSSLAREVKALNLQTSLFSLGQIKTATNNFDISNKIGEGGFGPVYRGILSDGTRIAVKQLSSKSKQGNREFINEIGLISALQHPCLVKLYGCCVEGDQLLLIYEYMENNSLARALFGQEECQIKLDWSTRQKICVGIARGLAYLHEESRLKIVHRDIKATNVLLDKDLNPKISDFGLAKLDEENNTHISTKIAGTYGYMAPEYAMHGYLTDKADVYSFGIVTLEIVSGNTNTIHGQPKDQCFYLLDWVHFLKEKGNLMELVDRRLGSDFNAEEVMVMIKVALLCTNVTAALRPTMSSVVSMLEGSIVVPVAESSVDEKKLEAMRVLYYQQIEEYKESEIQNQSASMDGPWTASSSSAADLYPIRLDSSYWEKRN